MVSPLLLRIDSLKQSFQVAYSEKPRKTMIVAKAGIAHPRVVIRATYAIIADVAVCLHTR